MLEILNNEQSKEKVKAERKRYTEGNYNQAETAYVKRVKLETYRTFTEKWMELEQKTKINDRWTWNKIPLLNIEFVINWLSTKWWLMEKKVKDAINTQKMNKSPGSDWYLTPRILISILNVDYKIYTTNHF